MPIGAKIGNKFDIHALRRRLMILNVIKTKANFISKAAEIPVIIMVSYTVIM